MIKFFACGIAIAAMAWGAAQPPAPRKPDDDLRLPGIFQSPLPTTEGKGDLKLTLRPHFGDLTKRDYLRVPLGLRYGATDYWELTAETETYFSHGLRDKAFFKGAGLAGMRLATKYQFPRRLFKRWDTAVGLEYSRPVDHPPPQLTDGYQHVQPFVTFARPLISYPGARIFWGLAADLISATDIPGEMVRNQLVDDSLTFTSGIVWQRDPFTYTFETAVATTRAFGDIDEELISVRPGVLWEVPSKYTFNSKAEWRLGVGLRAQHGPKGADFGVSARVRVNFDFKRWLRERRATQASP